MKVYKVDLYKVHYIKSDFTGSTAVVHPIGKVIVQKGLLHVKELLTGYSKIGIVPKNGLTKANGSFEKLDVVYWNQNKANKEGAHLFVVAEDLSPKNMAKAEDIDHCVEEYETSKWKKEYESIKAIHDKSQSKVHQKAKEVSGIKK